MTTTINDTTFLWVSCIFVILANLAVMIVLYIYKPSLLKKISHPLIISIFLLERQYLTRWSKYIASSHLGYTGRFLSIIFLFCWLVLDTFIFKPKEKGNDNNNDDEVNEVNEENENTTNEKKIDFNNFDFSTAIFAVLMWVTYMMNGMVFFNDMKGSGEGDVQTFFYYVLRYATLQFAYGMFVINQGTSKLLYLIYMTPQSLLWPLASIISYYVNQKDPSRMTECFCCFNSFMAGTLLFFVFKEILQYPKYVQDDFKNKGIHLLFLLFGLIWYNLVSAVGRIENYHYNYD